MPPRRVNRGQSATPIRLPAPIGGLNARDPIENMAPTDAFELVNFFPKEQSVALRTPLTDFALVTSGGVPPVKVETLAVYDGGATQSLLAFGNGMAWDITAGGAVGAPLVVGWATSRLITCMFSNAGAQFLVLTQGTANLMTYDPAGGFINRVIGGGPATIDFVMPYKGRLYFTGAKTLGFYYLAVGAVAGAAAFFDLSQVASRGGYVVSISSYSFDTGVGPGAFVVFATNLGEYIVYQGNDPAVAANFSLVARYYAAPPVGARCAYNFRGDLVFLTLEGVIPFSAIRAEGEAGERGAALTDKISSAVFAQMTAANVTQWGWQMVSYPLGNMFLVNTIDADPTERTQFVMNMRTRAWTQFRLHDPEVYSMQVFHDKLYFSVGFGLVYVLDVANPGTETVPYAIARQAYTSLGEDNNKRIASAVFYADVLAANPFDVAFSIGADGDRAPVENTTWNVADVALTSKTFECTAGAIGYVVAPHIKMIEPQGDTFEWKSTRFFMQRVRGFP